MLRHERYLSAIVNAGPDEGTRPLKRLLAILDVVVRTDWNALAH